MRQTAAGPISGFGSVTSVNPITRCRKQFRERMAVSKLRNIEVMIASSVGGSRFG